MASWFSRGDRVVCISGFFREGGEIVPHKGETYTVRDTDVWDGEEFLYLEEIVNPPQMCRVSGSGEPCWHAREFRRAVSAETSIEIFQKMLVHNEKEKERA